MAQLQSFTLTQLKQLLDADDQRLTNNYISQNLAVARNVHLSLIKEQFSEGSPLLMPEMRMLLLKSGWVEPTVNLTEQRFEAGDLDFLGPHGIVQFRQASSETTGIGISMSNELFSLALGGHTPKAFDGHVRDFHFHLQPDEMNFFDRLHELLYNSTRAKPQNPQVTLHLISALLWQVDHLWSRHEEESRRTQSREQRLFTDFIRLVNQHAAQQHNIGFYADHLFLSPRYMSTMIKQISGRAAKEWIDDAIITRIKVELRHSDRPITTISDQMNFPNVSFFCKYFKRLTGMTPMRYRMNANA